MKASIEMRVPLVNKYILVKNFFEEENKLIDFFKTKKQLKTILYNILPKNLIDRKKIGFNPPMDELINSLGKEKIISIFEEGNLEEYINMDLIYELVQKHFIGKDNNTYKIWQILYLHYWIKENQN
jgi:asparagine synthase (glutamine-hydrolysing)